MIDFLEKWPGGQEIWFFTVGSLTVIKQRGRGLVLFIRSKDLEISTLVPDQGFEQIEWVVIAFDTPCIIIFAVTICFLFSAQCLNAWCWLPYIWTWALLGQGPCWCVLYCCWMNRWSCLLFAEQMKLDDLTNPFRIYTKVCFPPKLVIFLEPSLFRDVPLLSTSHTLPGRR